MKLWTKAAVIVVLCTQLSACVGVLIASAAVGSALLIHDRRTVGSVIDDNALEFSGYANIRKAFPSQANRFAIESHNGIVLLAGQAENERTKNGATDVLQKMPSVRRVYNFMTIGPAISANIISYDIWLGSKIKGQLTIDPNIDPTRINVVVENGVVYLMGIVSSFEAKKATDIARYQHGVKRVMQLFELLAETK